MIKSIFTKDEFDSAFILNQNIRNYNWDEPLMNRLTDVILPYNRESDHLLIFEVQIALEYIIDKLQKEATNPQDFPGENLRERGKNYYYNNPEVSIKEVLWDIFSNKENEDIIEIVRRNAEEAKVKKEKHKITLDQISSLIYSVGLGYKCAYLIDLYKYRLLQFKNNIPYFERFNIIKSGIRLGLLNFEIAKITLFQENDLRLEDTVKDVVERRDLIANLKNEFESIVSPDKKRTTEDRLSNVKSMLFENTMELRNDHQFLREGYWWSIRGQNPVLIEYLQPQNGAYDTPDYSTPQILQKVESWALGYAYSFHLVFLEQKLKKINESDTGIEMDAKAFIKLKWEGNKNQLYSVIRQLKKQNLLSNSYPDIAIFLKQYVMPFENTSLSTIQTELEKEQILHKNRRISLDHREDGK